MIKYYIQLLNQSFELFIIVRYSVLVIFILSIICLCLSVVILLLDHAYRPEAPQYPFKLIYDRIIPIASLFLPFFVVYFFAPFETWFTRFSLLLCIHIFVLIPLFYYWSYLRRWSVENSITYNSWYHPRLYLQIAVAMIYPLLWGMFFSLSRYLRLGSTFNFFLFLDHLTYYSDFIILSFFILPFYSIYPNWIRSGLTHIIHIRLYLWHEFSSLLYSIHIYLLRYSIYFFIMEKLFKFSFICSSLISLHGLLYFKDIEKYSLWRKFLDYLFYHSHILTFFCFISFLFELLLCNGNIFYSLYIFFFYPIIRSILSLFFSFGNIQWVLSCCLSDYVRKQWEFPRYPIAFWEYFIDASYYFNFEWQLTKEELDFVTKQINYYDWRLRKKVSRNVHQDLLYAKIRSNFKRPFGMRLKVSYVYSNRVRWMHTQAIQGYHSATSLFAKTIYDKIVLINSSWKNISNIQVADKGLKLPFKNIYLPFGRTYPLKRDNIIGFQEENTPTYFTEWIKRKVVVEPYNMNNPLHNPEYKSQATPDLYLNFKGSEFKEQRSLTLDQKTGDPGLGKHKIFSEISQRRYETTINNFEKDLRNRGYLTYEMIIALKELKESCLDISAHQMVWGNNLHMFHIEHIPPLKVPQNFNTHNLIPKALSYIAKAELRMKLISDYLYLKKIPQISHGIFSTEALDLFDDSIIQKILNENPIDD